MYLQQLSPDSACAFHSPSSLTLTVFLLFSFFGVMTGVTMVTDFLAENASQGPRNWACAKVCGELTRRKEASARGQTGGLRAAARNRSTATMQRSLGSFVQSKTCVSNNPELQFWVFYSDPAWVIAIAAHSTHSERTTVDSHVFITTQTVSPVP